MIRALRPHVGPFLGLMVLLSLTAICSSLPIGEWNLIVALTFAGMKTGLVVYFFMELRREGALIRIAACVGLVWLMIMLILALADFVSRFPGTLME